MFNYKQRRQKKEVSGNEQKTEQWLLLTQTHSKFKYVQSKYTDENTEIIRVY